MSEAVLADQTDTIGLFAAGRHGEIRSLLQILDDAGPRVAWVYGIAGIGKTTLLARFRDECQQRGAQVVALDCQAIEPTAGGFMAAVAASTGQASASNTADALASLPSADRVVVTIDTYELFRIADSWFRHSLVPALGTNIRLVIAGREPPMLEWATERARLGGMVLVPVGPLDDETVARVLARAGVEARAAVAIANVARGHPLAVRLAIEAHIAGHDLPETPGLPHVIAALATAFRDGLDKPTQRALDAASVTRRITRDALGAMLGADADETLAALESLAFVEPTTDGLRLHETVQNAVSERLRAVDPGTFRAHRRAAWRHLQAESHTASRAELWRSTADLLFLIDNPVIREALFPSTEHLYSVERPTPSDAEDVAAIWRRFEPQGAADLLDQWTARVPDALRIARDRAGTVVGAALTCEWNAIPLRLVRDDPVVAQWERDSLLRPLPPGQRTLVKRRWLDRERGESPGPVQAAIWLDIKRSYLELRPGLGRIYIALVDPQPYWAAMDALGFRLLDEPGRVDGTVYQSAALDFGPDSVDGWLAAVAARELGIEPTSFLDPDDFTADLGGRRIKLSRLEFGVLRALYERRGRPVSRVDLIGSAWGTSYTGGSNVVDVVVRGLRRKLGDHAARIETVRGVGYRLR